MLCFTQHHLKRLLAYSTISHVGLFLLGVAVLDAKGIAGSALYVLGHAGAKDALFLGTGVLVDRFESVSEEGLFGRGRGMVLTTTVFALGGLALAGLPPFGTWLGKSVTEEALSQGGYSWGPAVFVAASALTGGAVLRVAMRVFFGLGAPEPDDSTSQAGERERSESDTPLRQAPLTMLGPALALLVGSLVVGVLPGLPGAVAEAAARFVDTPGYVAQVLHAASPSAVLAPDVMHVSAPGLVSGVVSTLLALLLAVTGTYRHRIPAALRKVGRAGLPPLRLLRQVHSGHLGDQVSWLVLGTAASAALVALGAR